MTSDFDVFHRITLKDLSLQAALDDTICPDVLAQHAQRAAADLGLNLDARALYPRRSAVRTALSDEWAPDSWLPVGWVEEEGAIAIDWARFGKAPLNRSFYSDSVTEARCRPFNRMFRHSTELDAFIDAAADQPSAAPAGFVFHMSRCGSTLVAQMLGAISGTIALSEPPPLDSAVRFALRRSDIPRERHLALIRAMIGALARPRNGERRCFVKLDSWHILALPLFRDAFPEVPWIYLFRDPVEVLVSQMRMRGYHTVPALIPAGLYDLGPLEARAPEMQCAKIFAEYHAAAISGLSTSTEGAAGLAVDYSTLPEAFETRIAPHFGLHLSDGDRERVSASALRDAKAPESHFAADSLAKQQEAGPAIRAAADHLAAPHAWLRARAIC